MKKLNKFILLFSIAFFLAVLSGQDVNAEFSDNDPYVFLNNVDDPYTVDEIKIELGLRVLDPEDGDLTEDIYIVMDNYTDHEDVLGDWLVVYGVIDSGGNESTYAITVRNVDITEPEFVIEAESTLNIPQYSHLASNLPQIKAIDSFEGDITSEIEITGLDLIDTDVIGEYSLIYTVSDSSGNTISETFMVSVVDSTPPTLEGPDTFIKRADIILDADFFLKYYTSEDDHDGIISNRIAVVESEYLGNADEPGTYQVVLNVSDTQGNFLKKNITIKVVKSMIPRLIIDNYYFVIDDNYLMDDDDFIDTLKFIEDLSNQSYIFTTTYDNYTNFYNNTGTYQKNFNLKSSSGEEYTREIVLEVVPSGENIVEQEPSWISQNIKLIGGIAGTFVLLGLASYGMIKG